MGWYKHSTKSRTDSKLIALADHLERPYKEIYAEWFWLLDICYEDGDSGELDLTNGGIRLLAKMMDLTEQDLGRWIEEAESVGLVCLKCAESAHKTSENDVKTVLRDVKTVLRRTKKRKFCAISPLNWERYAGDYTRRKIRKSQEEQYLQSSNDRTITGQSPDIDRSNTRISTSAPSLASLASYLPKNIKKERESKEGRIGLPEEMSLAAVLQDMGMERKKRYGSSKVPTTYPGEKERLAYIVRQWDGPTVVSAYRSYLSEDSDWLRKRKHPLGTFMRQFETHQANSEQVEQPQTDGGDADGGTWTKEREAQALANVDAQIERFREEDRKFMEQRREEDRLAAEESERMRREGI